MGSLKQVDRWVREVVIKHNLCPFAREPHERGLIRISECPRAEKKLRFHFFLDELARLQGVPPTALSTTLIAYPKGEKGFLPFLNFVASLEHALNELGARGLFQLVPFHPRFRLEGLAPSDPSNLVGRSPCPVVHVLRSEEVALAIKGHADAVNISVQNARKLRDLSARDMARIKKNVFA